MKKSIMLVVVAMLGMGICCFAGNDKAKTKNKNTKQQASKTTAKKDTAKKDASKDAAKKDNTQNAPVDLIIIDGVAYLDNCAQDAKSPCLKNGKCACADKASCAKCKAKLKKCDDATQKRCQQLIKEGICPRNGKHAATLTNTDTK